MARNDIGRHIDPMSGTTYRACEIFVDVLDERHRQDDRWGKQSHPDGTGVRFEVYSQHMRRQCKRRFAEGTGTWTDVFLEEVYEALAEADVEKLRVELVQVAAVIFAWVQDMEERE